MGAEGRVLVAEVVLRSEAKVAAAAATGRIDAASAAQARREQASSAAKPCAPASSSRGAASRRRWGCWGSGSSRGSFCVKTNLVAAAVSRDLFQDPE